MNNGGAKPAALSISIQIHGGNRRFPSFIHHFSFFILHYSFFIKKPPPTSEAVLSYTSFFAHLPDLSIMKPMTHLPSSKAAQMANRGMMGRPVKRERMSPVGTLTAHT